MPKLNPFTIKLSAKQIRQLARMTSKLELDRSNLIRLAIARLWEEEMHRDPKRGRIDKPNP
jgi:hypothetical protein